MENETKTIEHERDGNGNVIIQTQPHQQSRWAKPNILAVISGAFAFMLLVTTCAFGVGLTRARAANNQLLQELDSVQDNYDSDIIYIQESDNSQNEPCKRCAQWPEVYYYYEYRF